MDTEPRNPSWSADELILALEVYVKFKGEPPGKASDEIRELSLTLNRLAKASEEHGDTYRNVNGVYMKLMNFRRFDPKFKDAGKAGLSRGSKLEGVVWSEFAQDPKRLADTARAIRANLGDADALRIRLEPEIEEAEEGGLLTRVHLSRERSRKIVQMKKAEALKIAGKLVCEACSFDFALRYGSRGEGFIEVHHAKPVHTLTPGDKTKLSDLHLLCANCHRMVHSKRPWLTIAELQKCLQD